MHEWLKPQLISNACSRPHRSGDWGGELPSPFRVVEEDLRSVGAGHEELVVLNLEVLQPQLRLLQACHLEGCRPPRTITPLTQVYRRTFDRL